MRPVSETPTEPRHYAALSLLYSGLLAAALVRTSDADPIRGRELPALSAATFALTRLIVHEKVETWARRPFVDETAEGSRPKGSGTRYVVGELLSCSRCSGSWSALGLVALRLRAPGVSHTVNAVLTATAVNDAMQAGFSLLTAAANRPTAARS